MLGIILTSFWCQSIDYCNIRVDESRGGFPFPHKFELRSAWTLRWSSNWCRYLLNLVSSLLQKFDARDSSVLTQVFTDATEQVESLTIIQNLSIKRLSQPVTFVLISWLLLFRVQQLVFLKTWRVYKADAWRLKSSHRSTVRRRRMQLSVVLVFCVFFASTIAADWGNSTTVRTPYRWFTTARPVSRTTPGRPFYPYNPFVGRQRCEIKGECYATVGNKE